MSLLEETLSRLKVNGKTEKDVRWVGSYTREIGWDLFAKLAERTYYDSGYGAQKIATDLIIVGDNWWMTRAEYDGSEWWEFHTMPTPKNKESYPVNHLGNGMWDSLKEINEIDN